MAKRKGDFGQLVEAAAQGRPYAEIARAAGLSIATVKRRLQDPEIVEAVREARRHHHRAHAAQLSHLSGLAIARLSQLLSSDDEAVALRATQLVLGTSIKMTGIVDFDERLGALERASLGEALDDRAN